VQKKAFGKSQVGAISSGSECAIHTTQELLVQCPKYDFLSADAIKAFYNLNRDLALDIVKKEFPEVYDRYVYAKIQS
jgi:hypothetical protein